MCCSIRATLPLHFLSSKFLILPYAVYDQTPNSHRLHNSYISKWAEFGCKAAWLQEPSHCFIFISVVWIQKGISMPGPTWWIVGKPSRMFFEMLIQLFKKKFFTFHCPESPLSQISEKIVCQTPSRRQEILQMVWGAEGRTGPGRRLLEFIVLL